MPLFNRAPEELLKKVYEKLYDPKGNLRFKIDEPSRKNNPHLPAELNHELWTNRDYLE